MIKYIFEESCFLNLEDDQGQMIGYTPHEIITHICNANVAPEDHNNEISAIEEDMRKNYDPNERPQVYFKKLQPSRILLLQLLIYCPEKTLIRTAMIQFQQHMDLNDAVER
jgi:hypothetical protein